MAISSKCGDCAGAHLRGELQSTALGEPLVHPLSPPSPPFLPHHPPFPPSSPLPSFSFPCPVSTDVTLPTATPVQYHCCLWYCFTASTCLLYCCRTLLACAGGLLVHPPEGPGHQAPGPLPAGTSMPPPLCHCVNMSLCQYVTVSICHGGSMCYSGRSGSQDHCGLLQVLMPPVPHCVTVSICHSATPRHGGTVTLCCDAAVISILCSFWGKRKNNAPYSPVLPCT